MKKPIPSSIRTFIFLYLIGAIHFLSYGQSQSALRLKPNGNLTDSALVFPNAGGPVTIEYWVRVNSSEANQQTAFKIGNNQGGRFQAHCPFGSNGDIIWDYGNFNGVGRISTSFRKYQNQWVHVALVSQGYKGKFKAIYINGLLAAKEDTSDGPNQGNVPVGALTGLTLGLDGFAGALDEFRVWKKVRSQSEIRINMCRKATLTDTNLVAQYSFDQRQGRFVKEEKSGAFRAKFSPNGAWLDKSGAAIGTASNWSYGNVVGKPLFLAAATDSFVVVPKNGFSLTDTLQGVQVYRVDTLTNDSTRAGLAGVLESHYYGYYAIGGNNPKALVAYSYFGQVGITDTNKLRLATRRFPYDSVWAIDAAAFKGTNFPSLGDTIAGPGEYILGTTDALANPFYVCTGGPASGQFNTTTTSICLGQSLVFNINSPQSGVIYKWYINNRLFASGNNASYLFAIPGNPVIKLISNKSGCKDSFKLSVVVLGQKVSHAKLKGICLNQAPFFLIGGTPANGKYSGPGVVNGIQFNPAQVGVGNFSLTYKFTDGQSGCSDSVLVPITVDSVPVGRPNIQTTAQNFCQGDSLKLTAIGGKHYLWNTGDTSASIYVKNTGTYKVWLSSLGGCLGDSSSPIAITADPSPARPSITQNLDTLFASGTGTSYQWSFNGNTLPNNTPFLASPLTGTYTLKIGNGGGCFSQPSAPFVYVPRYAVTKRPGAGMAINIKPGTSVLDSGTILPKGGGPVTVEYWMNTDANPANANTLFFIGNGGNGRFQAHSPYRGSDIYWDYGNFNGNGRLVAPFPASLKNKWVHIALVSAGIGGHFKAIYINGNLAAVDSVNPSDAYTGFNAADPVTKLQFGAGGDNFNGLIDEFRVWNTVRTTEQLRTFMCRKLTGSESNLKAYFTFEEGTGPNTLNVFSGQRSRLKPDGTGITPGFVRSGAALGDTSIFNYNSNSINASLAFGNTDTLAVDSLTGSNKLFLQMYSVKRSPENTSPPGGTGKLLDGHYYGIYALDGSGPVAVKSNYKFGGQPGVADRNTLYLASRNNNADSLWVKNGRVSTGTTKIKTTISSQAEIILGSDSINTFTTCNGTQGAYYFTASDTIVCKGSTVSFDLIGPGPASDIKFVYQINGVSFAYGQSATYRFTQTGPQTIRLVVSNKNGCSNFSEKVITVNGPNATLGNFPSVCAGIATLPLTGGLPAGGTYLYNNQPITGFTPNLAGPGNYTIKYAVSDANGCKDTATANLTVLPQPPASNITVTGNLVLCSGDSVTLTAPSGASAYLWSNGATTRTIKVKVAGSYSVQTQSTVTACLSLASAPKVVVVKPLPSTPTISLTRPDSLIASPATGTNYVWYRNGIKIAGATKSKYKATQNGSYTVTYTDTSTCSSALSAPYNLVGVGENHSISDFRIYPNPSEGGFTLEFDGIGANHQVQVLNMLGQEVWSKEMDGSEETKNRIAVQLPAGTDAGLYMVCISGANGVLHKSLVIK